MNPRGKGHVLAAGSAAAEWGTKSSSLEVPGELYEVAPWEALPLPSAPCPFTLCPTLYQMDFRGTWQLSVCLTSVSNHVHQGSPGKRPWKRLKVSCKLVKHLVTSHLVHVETEGYNRLLRRGCAVLKLSVKEVVGMREEILLSGGHVSQPAVPEQTSD